MKRINIGQLVCLILSVICYSLFTVVSAKVLGFSFMAQNGLKLTKINDIMLIPYAIFFVELFLVIYKQDVISMIAGGVCILFLAISTSFMVQIYLSGDYKNVYEIFIKVALPLLQKVPLIPEEYSALLTVENAEELIRVASEYFKKGMGFWGTVALQAAFILVAPMGGKAKVNRNFEQPSSATVQWENKEKVY